MLSKSLYKLSCKAVGPQGIPLFGIKNSLIGPHLHLINTSIITCSFPSDWKVASVLPLHKSASHDLLENYRPISILPALSKLCENVVCIQLSDYLLAHNLIAPSLYAYRPCHATEDAASDAVKWVTCRIELGHVIALTSIVFSKAFDSVSHDVLLTKFQWYGINHRWFQSYLVKRKQLVKGGSLHLPLTHGVPQGSFVGPILFSIFTNELPSHLPSGHLVSYADDTQLLDSAHPDDASLKSRQEESIKTFQSYFTNNYLNEPHQNEHASSRHLSNT